jgi:hypothetical protein
MTPEQVVANNAAAQVLQRGKWYRFDPPAQAGAIPTGGPNTCGVELCTFDRGWYIGFVDGNHMFQGKPINDTRTIPVPRGYEHTPKIVDKLRDSYFGVLFVDKGVVASVAPKQTRN